HLQHEMRAAAHPGQVLELLQHEGAYSPAVIVGVSGQLLDEERPHAPLLEVPHVDPAVVSAGVRRTLGVADDLVPDLEEQLVDVLLAVRLDEASLGEGTLVFHRLSVHVAEAELQELPGAVQVTAVDATDAHLERRLGGFGARRRHGGEGERYTPPPSCETTAGGPGGRRDPRARA